MFDFAQSAKVFNNVIPLDHCKKLEMNILKFKGSADETTSELYESSKTKKWVTIDRPYGYFAKNPETYIQLDNVDLIESLTYTMTEHFKCELEYVKSHLRLYVNGSSLYRHIDRENLHITLSVNIGGIETWPLKICNHKCKQPLGDDYCDDFQEYITPIGSGVASCGKIFSHWRDPLLCKEDEYVAQIFYHWEIVR